MIQSARFPVSVITRYLLSEFNRFFALILASFVSLYLLVDLFDRLDTFLKFQASAWAATRYLAFKIPLIITQVTPPAVLAATLLTLGMLSRRNELIALRTSGVSLYRVALPLLGTAAGISLTTLLWSETVVPTSTHHSQQVNLHEIRRQTARTILNDREIWYHGADGFYNIDHIDAARQTLYGISRYRLSEDFQLLSTLEVASAYWTGEQWEVTGAVERRIAPDGEIEVETVPTTDILKNETLDDFLEVYRDPDELSYTMLNERIHALTRKGIDASSYLVDLHLKLAVPFMSLVLAALAIPIAGRSRRHASVALNVGIGVTMGFSYWVVFALAVSLGHGGALPPPIAAWAANAICALGAAFLFLSVE